MTDPNQWSTENRKCAFNSQYFTSGSGGFGGYSGFTDTRLNALSAQRIRELKPTSVLEIGCARGQVLWYLENAGIPCRGLDVSSHAYLTRVTNSVQEWDITQTPWPFKNGQFDVCFSHQVLELIPEKSLRAVLSEIHRVSRRGLHAIEFAGVTPEAAKVQCIRESAAWWNTAIRKAGDTPQGIREFSEFGSGTVQMMWNTGPIKINCGCGYEMFRANWANADISPLTDYAEQNRYIFVPGDVSDYIPVHKDSTTVILASHLIHELEPVAAERFLSECRRALMAGGRLRVSVPDAGKLREMAERQELGAFDDVSMAVATAVTQEEKLDRLLGDTRLSEYTKDSLPAILKKVGFPSVKIANFRESSSTHIQTETYDTLADLSLFVEARKAAL